MAIPEKPPWRESANQGSDRASDKLVREHNRFAHFHDAAILGMYRNKTAEGLKGDLKPQQRTTCDSCELVKSKTQSIKPGEAPQDLPPYHTVAVDAIPIKPTSARGHNYDFMYVDRSTKSIHHDPRATKRQALDSLKKINDIVKSKGFRIRRLQSDSEAIFTKSASYQEYLRKQGIRPTTSAPYRHDQNGMLERQWQTQKSAGSTVMKHGRIAPKHWDIVLPAVAKTWDVLPLKSTGYTKSPYELREGRKPDVSRFVPLGAPSYIRRYKDEPSDRARPTLRPNAYLGKVIGYPEGEKGSYYVLLPDGSVKSRYDVVVNQDASRPDHVSTHQREEPDLDEEDSEPDSEVAVQQKPADTTPTSRTPSARTRPGPHPRYSTDQIVEPGTGSRGRIIPSPAAHMANGKDPISDPNRRPGRMPLPAVIPPTPRNLMEATGPSQSPEFRRIWHESAALEMKAFEGMLKPCTFEETIGHRIHLMFDKLRYKVDHDTGELVFKTRLVFNGSTQRKGIDFDESYSPTLSTRSLLIIIHIAHCTGSIGWQADIGSAYLQAIDDKELFVVMPRYWVDPITGRKAYKRLTGNTYGKKPAGRLWYFTIDGVLIDDGWIRCQHDICVYTKTVDGQTAILGLVVDDTIIFCNLKEVIDGFLQLLRRQFPKVTDCEPKVFAGMEISQGKEWVSISQCGYLQKLLDRRLASRDQRVKVPITAAMDKRVRIEPRDPKSEQNHFVEAGELRWLDRTRYDIAYALSIVSRHQSNSRPIDIEMLDKLYQYLDNTSHYKLKLGGRDKVVRLFLVVDGNKQDDQGMMCWMTYLSRDSGAVQFKCIKSKDVSISSTDTEIRSTFEAVKSALWSRGFLGELGHPQVGPTPIYTDSAPALDAYKSISNDAGTRYMIPIIGFIRQEIMRGTVSVHKIKGTHNPADMGTKPLPNSQLGIYTKYALHGMGMRRYNGYDDFVLDSK